MKKQFDLWFPFIIYFLFIPGLIVAIFLFSNDLKQFLLLNVLHPTPLSIIGSNYLHTDVPHMLSNLIAYLLVMALIFFFDYQTHKKMLYVNMLLLFLLLPIVTSLLNIVSLIEYNVNVFLKGFSAITAGVFGYLAYSLFHYIRERYQVVYKRSVFQLMWLIIYVNLAMISLIYEYYLIAIVIIFLILLTLMNTYSDYLEILNVLRKIDFLPRTILFFGFLLSLLAVVPGLFPENVQQNGMVVNVYAHYIGYIFGFGIPAIVAEYMLKDRKDASNMKN